MEIFLLDSEPLRARVREEFDGDVFEAAATQDAFIFDTCQKCMSVEMF